MKPEPYDIVDLAIMLRKLVYIVRKESAETRATVPKALALCDRAIDLLERKGLQGSPLREGGGLPPAASVGVLGVDENTQMRDAWCLS